MTISPSHIRLRMPSRRHALHLGRITATTSICILLIGVALGASLSFDGPSDHQAALDTEAAANEAPRSAAEQLRRDRALERMALQAQYGGENAVPEMRLDGSIQWRTKRGHKTGITRAAIASN